MGGWFLGNASLIPLLGRVMLGLGLSLGLWEGWVVGWVDGWFLGNAPLIPLLG